MFVLCVFYSNDKRHSQDNQDRVVVQMKYREQEEEKQTPAGAWMSVSCEVNCILTTECCVSFVQISLLRELVSWFLDALAKL